MGVALSWLVWYTTRLNAALLEARVQSSGLVLRYSGSTSCLRERTECGRSSFQPIYPLFFVCESVLGIGIEWH